MKGVPLLIAFVLCGVVAAAQAPDRSKPPAPGPAPALKLPTIVKRQLSNGLPAWIVELHEVPVVQVNLVVRAGTANDPAGKYGVASLTAAMLTEGAGAKSSLEIADAVDFLGADLNASSAIDASAVRLHVPVARIADALPIMADVALRPTFPAEELERQRQMRQTDLLQARDNPATIASLAFSRVLYGPSHRFGTAAMGTSATIKAFTRDDLVSFYRRAFRPDSATLVVVGDVTPDRVLPLLETHFGRLEGGRRGAAPGGAAGGAAADTPADLSGRQARARRSRRSASARSASPASTPDFFAIQVMNTILGGAFSSRLNLNLREKRGYTYGASSGFDMRLSPGPFSAQAGVQTDKTSESLTEFFNELNAILKPVPADELARAKNYVALRFPSSFETTGDIARRLEEAIVYRLPDDYYSRYVQNIEAVTAADVQRVAQKYIQPDRLAVVVVGDRKTIEPGIRALNLGAINTLTIDELFK